MLLFNKCFRRNKEFPVRFGGNVVAVLEGVELGIGNDTLVIIRSQTVSPRRLVHRPLNKPRIPTPFCRLAASCFQVELVAHFLGEERGRRRLREARQLRWLRQLTFVVLITLTDFQLGGHGGKPPVVV